MSDQPGANERARTIIVDNSALIPRVVVKALEAIEDAMIGGAKDYLRKSMAMNEMVNRLERHVTRAMA